MRFKDQSVFQEAARAAIARRRDILDARTRLTDLFHQLFVFFIFLLIHFA